MKKIRFILVILFLGLLAVSPITCGGSSSTSIPTLESISVSLAIPVGSSQKFEALGTYSNGTAQDITPLVTWTSSNTSVATVNSSGRVTPITPGTATITATSGSVSGSTTVITVTSLTLSSITVTQANPNVPVGLTQQFTALATYSDGTSYDITPLVSWASSNTSVATVNGSGLTTAVAAGRATITATSGSVSGSTTLNVTAATLSSSSIAITPTNPSISVGTVQQFAATGTFSDGTNHDITPLVTWASSNTSVATINGSGLATAVAAGSATITATSGIFSASTTLNVTTATLSTVAVLPAVPAGAIEQFVALGTFSDGSIQGITQEVSWTSSNTSVATVSTIGRATAVAPGSAVLFALQANGNLSASTTLLVNP